MLKIELHAHSDDDPADVIPYSTDQLIDHAAACAYQALAITLHDRHLDLRRHLGRARDKGITLLPGVERTIEGKHVLLINFSPRAAEVRSFDDVARLRQQEPGLVVAPHPFFPHPSCLQTRRMDRYADLFDAVEYNGMFTTLVNFNRAAERWARAHGKPVVGAGDVHRLHQLDMTYTLVDAEAHPDAICEAVRAGKVRVEARPHSTLAAGWIAADMFGTGAWHGLRRLVSRERATPARA